MRAQKISPCRIFHVTKIAARGNFFAPWWNSVAELVEATICLLSAKSSDVASTSSATGEPTDSAKAQRLSGAEIEEDHAEEDEGEVDGFAAEVLLLEDNRGEEEADDDAAAADHRDD